MPIMPFNDLLTDTDFQSLPTPEKLKLTGQYWDKFEAESPQNAEYAQGQRKAVTALFDLRDKEADATPLQKRMLRPHIDVLSNDLAANGMVQSGAMTQEEAAAFTKGTRDKYTADMDSIAITRSLYDPKIDREMKPAWDSLYKNAVEGNKFGTLGRFGKLKDAVMPDFDNSGGPIKESAAEYDRIRDHVGKTFNLEPAEVDDLVKHRMGLQTEAVSRDAFGVVHIKDDVLHAGADVTRKALEESNLPASVKARAIEGIPEKLQTYKATTLAILGKQSPQLAKLIGISGDESKLDEDFDKVSEALFESRTSQGVSGFSGGLDKFGKWLFHIPAAERESANVGFKGLFGDKFKPTPMGNESVPLLEKLSRFYGDRAAARDDLNELSHQLNGAKVEIFGTDAAAVGQGIYSAGESVAIMYATAGLGKVLQGSKLAQAVNAYGKAGQYAVKAAARGADIAPLTVIYGTQQAKQTYDQAIKAGKTPEEAGKYAFTAGVIEGGITMLASVVGLGGTEAVAAQLANKTFREGLKKSVLASWRTAGGKALLGVAGEELEENTIAFMDAAMVQAKLNPGMTSNDFGKILQDTSVATIFASAPLAGFHGLASEGGNLLRSTLDKPTIELSDEQLHKQADATYVEAATKENIPEAEAATGGAASPGAADVASGGSSAAVDVTMDDDAYWAKPEDTKAREVAAEEAAAAESSEEAPAAETAAAAAEETAETPSEETAPQAPTVNEPVKYTSESGEVIPATVTKVNADNTVDIALAEDGSIVSRVPVDRVAPVASEEPAAQETTTDESVTEETKAEPESAVLSDRLSEIDTVWNGTGVTLDLSISTAGNNNPGSVAGAIVIDRLKVPENQQRKGIGSTILSEIKGVADSESRPVEVLPVALGKQSVAELEQFYMKNGFVAFNRGGDRQQGFRYTPNQTPAEESVTGNTTSPTEPTPEADAAPAPAIEAPAAPTPTAEPTADTPPPTSSVPTPAGSDPTSLKNAATDKILSDNGMAPIMAPARISNQTTWDKSMAAVEDDPAAGAALIKRIKERNVSVRDEVEEGVLLHELATRKANVARKRNAVLNAKNPEALAEAKADLVAAQDTLLEAVEAARIAGTAWGRIGQFRQRFVEEDFSLTAMEIRFRAEIKDGGELSDSDNALIARLNAIIEANENKLVALNDRFEKLKQDHEEQRILDRMIAEAETETAVAKGVAEATAKAARATATRNAKAARRKSRGQVLDARVKDARERLMKAMGRANAGIDPSILADVAIIAASYLNKAVLTVDELMEKLVEDLGEWVKDLTKSQKQRVYDKAVKTAAEEAVRAETPAKPKRGPRTTEQLIADLDPESPELTNALVFNMARALYNQGLRKTEILDGVVDQLQEEFPDITRQQVSDAFTGYGKQKFPSKDEDLAALRELRNAERILRQLEDVAAGRVPLKTGLQRDKPTEWVRQQTLLLKEAMKKAGMDLTTSENQLAGTLNAIKTRLKNRISDLTNAIKERTKIPDTSRPVAYDEDAKKLKEEADKLQAEYDAIFDTKQPLTDAQRIERAIKSLDRRIAEEKQLVADGKLARDKQAPNAPSTPEIEARQAELDKLVADRQQAQKDAEVHLTPEELALKRAIESTQRSIDINEETIRTGVLPTKAAGAPYTSTTALDDMKKRLKDLKDVVKQMRKNRRTLLTADEKTRRRLVASLAKTITDLQDRIARADLSPRTHTPTTVSSPAIVRLRAQQAALRAQLEAMKAAANPPLTPIEKQLKRDKAALLTQIAKIKARTAANDFEKPFRQPPAMDTEKAKLMVERSKAQAEWHEGFFKKMMADRTLLEKAGGVLFEAVSFSRTVKTIFDIPPVFRQGGWVTLGRPELAFSKLPGAIMAGFSETKAAAVQARIEATPRYALKVQAKLALTESGPKAQMRAQEEAFRGNWAKKVPALKHVVNFSERNYVTFLNELRSGLFDIMADSISTTGEITPTEAKIIANYINNATGRGSLGDFEGSSKALATVFFSAKYATSRFRLILGTIPVVFDIATGFSVRSDDTKRARKAIAKEYARTLTGIGTVFLLASLAGAGFGDDDDEDKIKKVTLDPRSSDFGKIIIGENRFDIMGGLLQATTLLARLATVETVSNGKVKSLNDPGFGKTSYKGVVLNFVAGKLAPAPGAWLNAASGRDPVYNKATVASEGAGLLIPISFNDLYDAARVNDTLGTLGTALMISLGAGYAVYDKELSLQQEAGAKIDGNRAQYEK